MQNFCNRCFIVAPVFLLIAAFSGEALAATFKPGDRVEAKKLGDWKPGVVLGINKNLGLVEIQFDDDGSLPARLPPEMRKRALQRSVEPEDVRPLASVKPEKAAEKKPSRTWKDRTGKFNIEATFQGLRDGKVILETAKGKRIEVPLEKLSEDDAKYVQDQKDDEDNPFRGASGGSNTAGSTTGSESTSTAKLLKANRKGAKNVQPKSFANWSFKPEAKPATVHSKLQNQQVELTDIPGSDKFFEDILDLYVSNDGTRVLVAREEGKVGGDKGVFLQELNLLDERAGNLVALPPSTKTLDAWVSESLVAYRPDFFGSGSNGLLTIAKLEGSQLTPIVSWNPYDNEHWKDIEKAWFLPNRRIMTVNTHGEALTIWNFDEAKAQLIIPIKSVFDLKSCLSADRQWLAIAIPERIAIIDLSEGTHVATLSIKADARYENMAFSDNNQKLMAVSAAGISQWDLTTGKLISEFWHPKVSEHSKAHWAGDFIFMGDQYLFDPARRILLWEYSGKQHVDREFFRGGRMWAVSKSDRDKQGSVMTTRVPNEPALQLASQLESAEKLLIAKPGDSVAIKVEVDAAIAPADEVRQAIAARLTEAGFKVVDQAELLVTAICQRKEQQTIKINTGNRFRPQPSDIIEKTITPHSTYMSWTLRGEKIWEKGYLASAHSTIFLNEGETLDQALERMTRPNIDMLKNMKFTAYLARPGKASDNGAYGKSSFTGGESF